MEKSGRFIAVGLTGRSSFGLVSYVLLVIFTAFPVEGTFGQPVAQRPDGVKQEESRDYFRKWLDEDVVYIIRDDERAVFQRLTTADEKEQFIEQFWLARDPDPRTSANEFREEHYRRIAYANEKFQSGQPGWQMDRGRVYIIHGPPDEIRSHPSGGSYKRPIGEGGGYTSTFPFEVWRYRYIEGLGPDVELEFVDRTQSGEYRLAMLPEEKDALLYVSGAGLTLAESLGWVSKSDRPFFNPGIDYPYLNKRARDDPFTRFETFALVKAPPPSKFPDLKEMVQINVSFDNLPFRVGQYYLKLNASEVLIPLTVEIENKDLSFVTKGDIATAQAAIYGLVRDMSGRVEAEFEDALDLSCRVEELPETLRARSMYQRMLSLDKRKRYKIELVVKDFGSQKTGVYRGALSPPDLPESGLTLSSLILSNSVRELGRVPNEPEMFLLGDVKLHPSIGKQFPNVRPLSVYLQIYNAGVDQSTLSIDLTVEYRISRDGVKKVEVIEEKGESLRLYGTGRVVLLRSFPVYAFEPGNYDLELTVRDRLSGDTQVRRETFRILP